MTHDSDFAELEKFQLSEDEWETLEDYQKILQV